MKMTAVKSTNIQSVGWDGGELHVTFASGETYAYSGVDKDTYENLMGSDSLGSFLHRNIRGRYQTRREG